MAFAASGLKLLVNTVGGGPKIWYYTSTDAHATVEGTDYFAGMGRGTASLLTSRDMRVGDIVFVVDSDAPAVTIHEVSAVDSEGNATVSAATLA
jgi:CTP:molybdopterin cytidylyltransferase MocA